MKVFVLLACFVAYCAAVDVSSNYQIVYETLTIPDAETRAKLALNPILELPGNRGGRLINGFPAADGQFPWVARMATMTPTGNFLCSGSLISTGWILSAFHCVQGWVKVLYRSLTFTMSSKLSLDVTAIEFAVGNVDRDSPLMHRVFSDRWAWLNDWVGTPLPDIAVFHLVIPVTFSPYIGAIRLPSFGTESNTWEGSPSLISGWGLNQGVATRFLQYGTFRIVHNSVCNFVDFNVCAVAYPNLATSTQGGDSGN